MPVAEILAIGTELLLGEIQDTNTRFIARLFRDAGVDLYRTSIVGDNAERIAQAIRDALTRADFLLTTGGLGPTVDDPTRQAVALAAGVDLEYHPELWDQILDRFRRFSREPSENNRRQAYIPRGSRAIENRVGTAPAFITKINDRFVISLPGVPSEMEWLMVNHVMPFLHQQFTLTGIIKARVLHLSGVGESRIDEWISDLELLSNPTVGLAAHTGQVDIRITAKADTSDQANQMIADLEAKIRQRVGEAIYGTDQDTLVGVILQMANQKNITFTLVDCGGDGELTRRLVAGGYDASHFSVISSPSPEKDLEITLSDLMNKVNAIVGIAASYLPGTEKQELRLLVITPAGRTTSTRSYGGAPTDGILWSINTALDALRRALTSINP
jgi:nicotinamide-nucleotide amidase